MAGFEELGREYLRDLLGEEPVYPVTHPKGPRGIEQLEHAPWVERVVFEEEEQPPGRCVLRRSCGRSCYCAKAGAVLARQGDDPRPLTIRYAPEAFATLQASADRGWI